jgi:hypothetical protein
MSRSSSATKEKRGRPAGISIEQALAENAARASRLEQTLDELKAEYATLSGTLGDVR